MHPKRVLTQGAARHGTIQRVSRLNLLQQQALLWVRWDSPGHLDALSARQPQQRGKHDVCFLQHPPPRSELAWRLPAHSCILVQKAIVTLNILQHTDFWAKTSKENTTSRSMLPLSATLPYPSRNLSSSSAAPSTVRPACSEAPAAPAVC